MNVYVDEGICVGCGNCAELCPEIFEMDDGLASAKISTVPEDQRDSCRDAAESCPVDAIIIKD